MKSIQLVILCVGLATSSVSLAEVKVVPAYNEHICPKIKDVSILGANQYELKRSYSTFYMDGAAATTQLVNMVSSWSHSFSQNSDLLFRFRDLRLCVGLYDDSQAQNAFALGKEYILLGISMAARLEDLPEVSGKTAIELVIAHEFAHFVQNQHALKFNYTLPMLSTKMKEQHADCMAGAIVSYFQGYSFSQLMESARVMKDLKDPHIVGDHGTEEQRVQALMFGFSIGRQFHEQKTNPTSWDLVRHCGVHYRPNNI